MAEALKGRFNFVCIDDSDFSATAFNWYVKNFHQTEDCIGLVHVYQMPSFPAMGLMAGGVPMTDEYNHSVQFSIREAKAIKSKFETCCKENNLKFQFFMADAHHSPGHVICDLAKEKKADTIIMGQRGLGAISRTLLGSTSDYVLHHAHVPVMVVPSHPKK